MRRQQIPLQLTSHLEFVTHQDPIGEFEHDQKDQPRGGGDMEEDELTTFDTRLVNPLDGEDRQDDAQTEEDPARG